MPRCPHCNFETTVISAFCPACGGAMQTQDAAREQQEPPVAYEGAAPYGAPAARPVFRQNTLGMGWLRFLAMFLLPLNIINGILSLLDLPDTIAQFRSPEISALITQPEKTLFFASVILSVVQVPLLCFALWGLFTQRWKGVQALLANYAISALYAIATAVVLLTIPIPTAAPSESQAFTSFSALYFQYSKRTQVISTAATAVVLIILFFANRVYFQKRRGFFLPEKQ